MKKHLLILFSLFVSAFLLVGCNHSESEVKQKPVPENQHMISIKTAQGDHEANAEPQEKPTQEPIKETRTMIVMKTTHGDIQIELNAEKAPKTVANFLKYAESGHYNGTVFHRVIEGFMVQGGGFSADMIQKKAAHTVDNEANNGLKNSKGSIAMARTPDPHSAGAQFFFNVADNAFLDFKAPTQQGWGYCVFGKVVEGMDVIKAIEGVSTGTSGGHGDVPREPITITEVKIVK